MQRILESLLTVVILLDILINVLLTIIQEPTETCESQAHDLNKKVELWILKLKEGRKLTTRLCKNGQVVFCLIPNTSCILNLLYLLYYQ